jgi:hypothetical protein
MFVARFFLQDSFKTKLSLIILLLAFGFWLLAFGFWLLAFGFWLLGQISF